MEINETALKNLIAYIVQKVKEELRTNREEIFVLLTDSWKKQYPAFFEDLKQKQWIHINTVLPQNMENEYKQKIIEICGNTVSFFNKKEIDVNHLKCYTTVFPSIPREIIVKTALGIDDTFETKWIRECFEKGQKIIFLSTGLEKFTGKEPQKYVQTMQEYFRTILEYGIEIKETIDEIECSQKEQYFDIAQNNFQNQYKKIITINDIENCGKNNKLILKKGDIITSLAQERAEKIGIHIIRE